MRGKFILALAVATAPIETCDSVHAAERPKPNIVHIFADDLGWGSVGFNGQEQIATPNLDVLANGGMTFHNAYAATVCAPSRAMLYTGFHQGHTKVDSNSQIGSGFRGEEVMTGTLLARAGYSTGIFGKWGFGASGTRTIGTGSDPQPSITAPASLPTSHGFQHFYGYLNHGAAHDYFYDWMWQSDANAPNGVVAVANAGGAGGGPEYTHDLVAARSQQYVAQSLHSPEPFYLQLNYTIPHFDLDAIADAPNGYGQYANRPWTSQQKAYAAMISKMDASVGELIAQLRDPNGDGDDADSVLDNTLIMFTSDNGPTPEDGSPIEFFDASGIYRGGKRDLYEGGIHVPGFAYWPGVIEAGSASNYRTDLADFMPTIAELAGVETPVGIDGTSVLPTLTGEGRQRTRDYLIFEHHEGSGPDADPRTARWTIIDQNGMKLIRYSDQSSDLFNLASDPSETAPLNLSNPASAQIAAEMEAIALAEGVHQGIVEYRRWVGANDGAQFHAPENWSGSGVPSGNWSASVVHQGAAPGLISVSESVSMLGFEVRGDLARQTIEIESGQSLSGRNEVRIGAGGRIELTHGALTTNRWINVLSDGVLAGQGVIIGDVYNNGVLAPGRSADLPASTTPPGEPMTSLAPIDLDTGEVELVTFDFDGVQDDAPLVSTTALAEYTAIAHGLDFGPGVQPRNAADSGDEFNIMGHGSGTLSDAIAGGDFISFTVAPENGAGIIAETVQFTLWRNGVNAAKQFAVLSSIDGFAADQAIEQILVETSGIANQRVLTATLGLNVPVSEPIEFRLYGWDANTVNGNTHVNAVSLSGRVVAVPTLEFDFAGVQDHAPLTALRRSNSNVALTAGLDFGPGINPRSPAGGDNNAGDEFHVAGFSTGSSIQNAIDGNDYLSFTVQAIPGMAMAPDSVSFKVWRQGSGSATEYAIATSLDGFSAGSELAHTSVHAVGEAEPTTLTAHFADVLSTEEPIEFRLYGWNAASTIDSTHVIAASMRAKFASSIDGEVDIIGRLQVQGDFYHESTAVLAIDVGSPSDGNLSDLLEVHGQVELNGRLRVTELADAGEQSFEPALGDSFTILTATEGIVGKFSQTELPLLQEGLDWHVDYSPNSVKLEVMSSADFDRDGDVDGDDLSLWKAGLGREGDAVKSDGDANGDHRVDGSDFLSWQRQFRPNAHLDPTAKPVPEPRFGVLTAAPAILTLVRSQQRKLPWQ